MNPQEKPDPDEIEERLLAEVRYGFDQALLDLIREEAERV